MSALFDPLMPDLPNAACADVEDPEIFFSADSRRFDREIRTEQARNICRRCPEIRNCLTWALEHREAGIWAATTDEQRSQLLARHRTP